MKEREAIEEILEHCLQRLDAGEDTATCLRDYPDYQDVLAPLLAMAANVRGLPAPALPAHVRTAARLRAREALARQASAGKRQNFPHGLMMLRHRAVRAVLAVVLVLGTLGTTIVEAQQSLPGNVLYGLKRSSEQVRVQLTPGIVGRAMLYLGLADRRVIEPLALLAQGRIPSAETLGEIPPAYVRAKDAIAQTQPADQVVLGERYNQLLNRHAREIETAFETTTLPNVRGVLQEIQQTTVRAGQIIVPSVLPQNAPPVSVSATAGHTIPSYTASPIMRQTLTVAPPTQTQASARTTTAPFATPTLSGEMGAPSLPTPTRSADRSMVPSPVSTPGGRTPATVTSLPMPSKESAISATTPPPTSTRDSATASVPGTPPPSNEPGPTATSDGLTPPPTETPTPRNVPTLTVTPSAEPMGRVTSTPLGEPTLSVPAPTLPAEPIATLTVTPPQTPSAGPEPTSTGTTRPSPSPDATGTPSAGPEPTSTGTIRPSPSPDATGTISPYPGPEATGTISPYPGPEATGTTRHSPDLDATGAPFPDREPDPTRTLLPYPGPALTRTTSLYPGSEQ